MLSDCLKIVFCDYKFYFLFENIICFDYMIEKLFNIYLYDFEIIFVVNGLVNVVEYFLKGMFINVLDFFFVLEFVKKLKEIGVSEEKYIYYFKEKDKYYDVGNVEVFFDVMCQLCNKLVGMNINLNGNNLKGNFENYWMRLMKNNC